MKITGKMADDFARRASITAAELGRGKWGRAFINMTEWLETARPKQLLPFVSSAPDIWIRSGRGWGKTRTLVEWGIHKLLWSGQPHAELAVVARTGADCRHTIMEGDSGFESRLPSGAIVSHHKSDGVYRLWNGAKIRCLTSEEPDKIRGHNFHFGCADETSSWRYLESLIMLEFCVRVGTSPQTLHTTTPKNNEITRYLQSTDNIEIIAGSTADNQKNLSDKFINRIYHRYGNTHLGAQEIHGEIIEDTPGALFTRAMIDENRIANFADAPKLFDDVIVAIDPQARQTEAQRQTEMGSETGIIAVGIIGAGLNSHFYVLQDASIRERPAGWAASAAAARNKTGANIYAAEVNQGGDMVREVLRQADPDAIVREVHQSKSKRMRAEPVSNLYESGRVHHIGIFGELEDQMCSWTGFADKNEPSPDRLDALVIAITELQKISGEVAVGEV